MGTTADKLNKLLETKAAIKNAIIAKGVEVADSDTFASYPAKIEAIEVGGGSDDFLAIRTLNHTNYNRLFSDYTGDSLDAFCIEQWDTSNVTNMGSMFNGCINLTIVDLSSFNTSKVTIMGNMFSSCSNLETVDIRNFNLSRSQSHGGMFYNCNKLHTLRLDNCDNGTINRIINSSLFPTGTISGVTRKIYVNPENLGILRAPENWIFVDLDGNEIREPKIYQVGYYRNDSEITEATTMVNDTHTDLSWMFYGCENLTTINNIEQWDTSNVTNMNQMFEGCRNLTSLDLSSFITSNVTDMESMFRSCHNLETLNISNFDMSRVENTDNMLVDCNNLRELRLDNCSAETVEKIINSEGFPTGDIGGEKRKMYVNSKAADVLIPIDGWVFIDCETEEEIEVITPSEKPAPPYEKGQFANNTDITVANTLVTKEHIDLNSMFSGCTNLAVVNTSDWDTSNVKNMNGMFYNCENLPYLDLSSFNTGNVEDMNNMFKGCTDLLYLDISNFTVGENCQLYERYDTKSGMFWDCTSLLDLRLDNCYPDTIERIINSNGFRVNPNNVIEDLPRVVYVRVENKHDLTLSTGSVFGYIEDPVYITNKDIAKWDYIDGKEIVNVIVDTQTDFDRYEDNNLEGLFEDCSNLRLINGIEQWNTTGIERMSYMFAGCTHLVSLNLSSFDISNSREIYNMFDGCTNLRYLDISNFIMGEESFLYNTTDMFRDCNNLRYLRLDNCDRNTIEKIVHGSDLPNGDINGEKRKMYVQEANIVNEWGDKPEAPDGWEFVYLVEAKKEEE